jgi:uncharacterized protein
MQNKKYTNALIHAKSPYLLQHAHNPVNWYAWDEDTLALAQKEDKLILVSIGYSACHWCHVMEHESFEDEEVAAAMNKHFICIKVDREERPDIDQVYMGAVQLMTGHGGWPLNCFALPDGRPVYGGTYFPKKQWLNVLENLADMYLSNKEKVLQYAAELKAGLQQMDKALITSTAEIDQQLLEKATQQWKQYLDYDYGGQAKAPKFPLPNNYLFLLRQAHFTDDEKLKQQVKLTLRKMAYGGIYDQIGGGFARYSVDSIWKVPHFEKMLYDNAQLISLYSEAYACYQDGFYAQIAEEIFKFLEDNLKSDGGAYYSAIDADSEGVEGKYYVWTKAELENCIPKADWVLFSDFYNINEKGYWEHDQYILLRDESFKQQLQSQDFNNKLQQWKESLLNIRKKRIHPGIDDKVLVSWNALLARASADAYKYIGKKKFKDSAIQIVDFILSQCLSDQLILKRAFKNGEAYIDGFLEDYATLIDALIAVYEVTGNEKYLLKAKDLTEYVIKHYYDVATFSFYFTLPSSELIIRKKELNDNVIPASNSVMAKNLLALGKYFGITEWQDIALQMCMAFKEELKSYLGGYTQYAMVLQHFLYGSKEVAIVGKAVDEKAERLFKHYLPHCIFALAEGDNSQIPLCQNRYVASETFIYVCENHSCQMPSKDVDAALALL